MILHSDCSLDPHGYLNAYSVVTQQLNLSAMFVQRHAVHISLPHGLAES